MAVATARRRLGDPPAGAGAAAAAGVDRSSTGGASRGAGGWTPRSSMVKGADGRERVSQPPRSDTRTGGGLTGGPTGGSPGRA